MMSKKPQKMTDEDIRNVAKEAMMDAVDFIESEIASDRMKAQRYFDGAVDIGEEDGMSKVVKTVIRDTVRAIKPSLMRVFLQSGKPVEYVPRRPDGVMQAEQATEYMHHKFAECDGYRVLNDGFQDALVKRVGIVKAWWESNEQQEIREYEGLSANERDALLTHDQVALIDEEIITEEYEDAITGEAFEEVTYNIKISIRERSGKLKFDSIPPEEFFVDRGAKNDSNFYVMGQRTDIRVGELVDMGYPYEQVVDLTPIDNGDSAADAERQERTGFSEDYTGHESADQSMKEVGYTEIYMKMDVEGTGIPSLYRVVLGGGNYEYLDHAPVSYAPYAIFEVDPEPHAFFGRSIADILFNEQDSSTAMIRSVLDNVQLTNNPRMEVVPTQTEIEDVLNNEIGQIIRSKVIGSVAPVVTPFVAGSTLPAIQYMDQEIEGKTGVTKASTGLSADALQNTTATAVQATVQANAGQIEVMARNLAEGGMRKLFTMMLKIINENVKEAEMMRFSGDDYVQVDPASWDAGMDVSVNVGLGTGQEAEKQMALQNAFQIQTSVMQQMGPNNGIVTLTQMRNTLADSLALAGIKNADRYFSPMTPEIEAQMQQQAAQAAQQPPPPDPQVEAYKEVEMAKVEGRAQSDAQKAQAQMQKNMMDYQAKVMEAMRQDDLQRDKMLQDLAIEAADILGKYAIEMNTRRVLDAQAQTGVM